MRALRSGGFDPRGTVVATEQDYVAHLGPEVDVVLADYALPGFDALRALELLRERQLDVPFLIVSAVIGEDAAVQAMRMGAADYLMKDRLGRLGPAVTRALEQRRLAIQKREAERALQVSEARFRALTESNMIGIVLADPEGPVLEANEAFLSLTGYQPEDVASRSLSWGCLVPAKTVPHRPFETECICKDGSRVPVLAGVVPLDLEHGEVIAFVLDLSALKRAERSMRQLSGWLLKSQDQERRRVARELHDSTAQDAAALAMNLSLLERLMAGDARALRIVAESRKLTEHFAKEIRALSYLLHPPLLDELGLASALRPYVEGFGRRTGVQVDLRLPADLGRLPSDVETTLFRIAQEALANVHRHSGSPTAEIMVERDAEYVRMEVIDQGCGLPPGLVDLDGSVPLGVGILGMRERARQLGGVLKMDAGPGGTRIAVTLPLEERP